uniref:Uncharacterized protein n=1 Tax=Panagrolaimus sp. JU765 TaxID=591449 RepID=A0AC34PZ91_9BILA
MENNSEKDKNQNLISSTHQTSPKPSSSPIEEPTSNSTPNVTISTTNTSTTSSTTTTTLSTTNTQEKKTFSPMTTKRIATTSAESITAPKKFSPSAETTNKKRIMIKKKNATEEAMEILTTRPSKIPGEKAKNADEYMPVAIEAPKSSSPGIIDETGAQIVTPKSTRITEMVKTATELETAIPLEEPPKAGVLLSAYIPVSFTTKGYIPTDNVEKSQSSAKTMKPPSPPLKKTNSSTSLSNLDIIEDVMSKKT